MPSISSLGEIKKNNNSDSLLYKNKLISFNSNLNLLHNKLNFIRENNKKFDEIFSFIKMQMVKYDFYLDKNVIIGETIYELSKLKNAFENKKSVINNIVNNTLITILDEILNRFSNISKTESFTNELNKEFYHFSNYLGDDFDFRLIINDIKYKWAYNLKRFNDNYIFMNYNLTCEANANISYKIGEFETKINGVIAKGMIGINSTNNFANQTVDANYFLNKNEVEYYKYSIKKHYKESNNKSCPNVFNDYSFNYLNPQNVCEYDEYLNSETINESENNVNVNRVF
jgi:hypothetical protein